MNLNQLKLVENLLYGIGLVVLIAGVFGVYTIQIGLIGALVIWMVAAVIKDNKRAAFLNFMAVAGVAVLIGGVFGIYDFKYGIIGALAIWMVDSTIRGYLKGHNSNSNMRS